MMDIWEKLYEAAKNDYNPHYVTPFIYSNHVVAAIEAEGGTSSAFNMFQQSSQTTIKRIIDFRDKAPNGSGSGMPCGTCREFLMQLSPKNKDLEFMIDYDKRETITLGELMPNWWGEECMAAGIEDLD